MLEAKLVRLDDACDAGTRDVAASLWPTLKQALTRADSRWSEAILLVEHQLLLTAVERGDPAWVTALLDQGAALNTELVQTRQLPVGKDGEVRYETATRPCEAAVHRAARRGHRAVLDALGASYGPARLLPPDLEAIRGLLLPLESGLGSSDRLGAMLDVNAIWVASGQTIWFYRWVKVAPFKNQQGVEVLAYYDPPAISRRRRHDPSIPEGPGRWVAVPPAQPQVVPQVVPVVSSERESLSAPAVNANDDDATYFAIAREVVGNFVGQFSGK